LFVGLVAMMMAAGLVLTGCPAEDDHSACSRDGDCSLTKGVTCTTSDCGVYDGGKACDC
jgi:hypothetical protein